MSSALGKSGLLIGALITALITSQCLPTMAFAANIQNLTGLPAYPNLSRAAMDQFSRTDKLGRWCTRFSAETANPLDAVEVWYRKNLRGASETDLLNDERYHSLKLTGIKLAVGIDYVTVFRTANQFTTSIELFRCSPL